MKPSKKFVAASHGVLLASIGTSTMINNYYNETKYSDYNINFLSDASKTQIALTSLSYIAATYHKSTAPYYKTMSTAYHTTLVLTSVCSFLYNSKEAIYSISDAFTGFVTEFNSGSGAFAILFASAALTAPIMISATALTAVDLTLDYATKSLVTFPFYVMSSGFFGDITCGEELVSYIGEFFAE
jgi:hypothetical protein